MSRRYGRIEHRHIPYSCTVQWWEEQATFLVVILVSIRSVLISIILTYYQMLVQIWLPKHGLQIGQITMHSLFRAGAHQLFSFPWSSLLIVLIFPYKYEVENKILKMRYALFLNGGFKHSWFVCNYFATRAHHSMLFTKTYHFVCTIAKALTIMKNL